MRNNVNRERSQSGKVRFRVVEIEVEGNDSSLGETMRSIQAALMRPQNGCRVLPPRASTSVVNDTQPPADVEVAVDGDDEAIDVEMSTSESESPAPAADRPRRIRKPVPVKIVDVDLKSGDMPLKSFAEKYKPKSVARKYLTIAAWLKEHRQIDEVDKDIIYTAFRHMGWSPPDDVGSVLRALYKQKLFDRVENGEFSLNHVGLDQALKGGDA